MTCGEKGKACCVQPAADRFCGRLFPLEEHSGWENWQEIGSLRVTNLTYVRILE